ncbi:MAG TPA: uroporphyrinogen decarboxylase family protein [Arenicellales bacterium]|mgnify:CR=1 FL=1|nr:uroporphyrinogen decarboxylase family protein [SAR324 cluster bacterium]MDP7453071.1 uroporphyrinogen decarboxylase family protein [Arenicellales bacterium]HJL54034.1 uroporphyrinogen decarboxylase family protein [Arenicellales bacterium]
MKSRERIQCALNHQEPDCVPIDFGGHRSSGIAAIAYAKLKKALGISSGGIYVYDMIQQLAIIEPEVLDAVGSDVVELGRGFMLDDNDWQDWVLPDGTPCKIPGFINVDKRGNHSYLHSDDGVDLAIQTEGCLYFEQLHWPWLDQNPDEQDFSDLEDALKYTMWTGIPGIPTLGVHFPPTDEGYQQLADGVRKMRESTDRAIVGLFGGNLFEVPQFLYRNDNYFMHMGRHPEGCERLSQSLCNFYMPRLERWLEAVAPYIDVVLFGDDLGGQGGPLISQDMYRRYYKPWHTKLWQRVKELAPNVNIHMHTCGGIEPLLNDLIEAGLESANPVQITCKGMEPEHLKRNYGDRFTFWGGGCDTQHVLSSGTPDQVRENVRELVSVWAPGGGFVFQQVHNILADVPPENIIAMFEAVRE